MTAMVEAVAVDLPDLQTIADRPGECVISLVIAVLLIVVLRLLAGGGRK